MELGESTNLVECFRSLCSLQAELQDLQSLTSCPDEDLRQLAAEETDSLLAQVLMHYRNGLHQQSCPYCAPACFNGGFCIELYPIDACFNDRVRRCGGDATLAPSPDAS